MLRLTSNGNTYRYHGQNDNNKTVNSHTGRKDGTSSDRSVPHKDWINYNSVADYIIE